MARFDQHENLFTPGDLLRSWCVEATPDRTLLYGYQWFGDRSVFTKYFADHDARLSALLQDYENGKAPEGPVKVPDQLLHNPSRFR